MLEAIQAGVTPGQGDATALWAIAWRAGSAAWMIRHRHLLEHVATAMTLREACNRARSASNVSPAGT